MIDTIRFEIHAINHRNISKIKNSLNTLIHVENSTGVELANFTKGSLTGSHDSRISIMVRDYMWSCFSESTTIKLGASPRYDDQGKKIYNPYRSEGVKHEIKTTRTSTPRQVPCRPYLIVEFSLPKWKYGINFITTDIQDDYEDLQKFRSWLSKKMCVPLPNLSTWHIKRVDTTILFDFRNTKNVLDYLDLFRHLEYPKRLDTTHYPTSFQSNGSIHTFKLYSKWHEFKVHDLKRIRNYYDKKTALRFLDLTIGLLKFEIGWKKRKLTTLQIIKASDLLNCNWYETMKKEMYKLINGAKTGKTYRFSDVVKIIMSADIVGSKISKEACIAVWSTIVTQGKPQATAIYGKMKISRAIKVYEQLGINTLGHLTDDISKKPNLHLVESNIFAYPEQNSTTSLESLKKVIGL